MTSTKSVISSIVLETKRLLRGCVFDGALDPYALALLEEVDGLLPLLERCERGEGGSRREDDAVDTLKILFAPTGPLQELSLDHGWGDAYRKLTEKAEAWLEDARRVKV